MFKEFFSSTWENIKERVRNPFTERNTTPFAGSFLIALIFYNWKLLFSLFNFDGIETRLTKIQIISNYLNSESWYYRVGNPILIAFASIVAFYILNNISLGITTFFNRWFKASVLAIFDKSKIVSREELAKSKNDLFRLRHKYEELNNTFSQSQATIEDLKLEIKNQLDLIEDYKKTSSQNLEERGLFISKINGIEKEYQKLKNFTEGFRVLYSYYGYKDKTIDVTEYVIKGLNEKGSFQVVNSFFDNNDPSPYRIKNLEIIFENNRQVQKISAIEGSNVVFFEDSLRAMDTDLSDAKLKLMRDRNNLSNLFGTNWKLFYTKDGIRNSEFMYIDVEGNYFANSIHTFLIDQIKITPSHIEFRKVTLSGTIHCVESLKIIEQGKAYTGKDSNNYLLEYIKNA